MIVFFKSLEEHEKDMSEVLRKLKEAGLKIELNNCIWKREEVDYLGHRVIEKGIRIPLDQNDLNLCFIKSEDFTETDRLEMLGRIEKKFTDIGASNLMDFGNICLFEHEVNTSTATPI